MPEVEPYLMKVWDTTTTGHKQPAKLELANLGAVQDLAGRPWVGVRTICVCMCVCVYVCMCVYIYIYIYIQIHRRAPPGAHVFCVFSIAEGPRRRRFPWGSPCLSHHPHPCAQDSAPKSRAPGRPRGGTGDPGDRSAQDDSPPEAPEGAPAAEAVRVP